MRFDYPAFEDGEMLGSFQFERCNVDPPYLVFYREGYYGHEWRFDVPPYGEKMPLNRAEILAHLERAWAKIEADEVKT